MNVSIYIHYLLRSTLTIQDTCFYPKLIEIALRTCGKYPCLRLFSQLCLKTIKFHIELELSIASKSTISKTAQVSPTARSCVWFMRSIHRISCWKFVRALLLLFIFIMEHTRINLISPGGYTFIWRCVLLPEF